MPLDKRFDYFYGIPVSLNYGILAWFEGRYAQIPPTVYTAKKKNDRHSDYRIMPPYQKSLAETKKLLKSRGMEVAPDFIVNQCLTRFTNKAIEWRLDGRLAITILPVGEEFRCSRVGGDVGRLQGDQETQNDPV